MQLTPNKTGEGIRLTVSVSGNLTGDEEGVELEGSTRLVNVAFYPKTTINVKFFEVILVRANGTKTVTLNSGRRTGTKLRDHLNKVYGKQCNVIFNIANDNTVIEVAYDVGDPNGRFAEYSKFPSGELWLRNPGNESLDCTFQMGNLHTDEELLVRAAGFDDNAVVNIYFLPRSASVVNGPVGENELIENSLFAGIAFRDKKMILIQSAGLLNEKQILHTVAHEIGHMPLTVNSIGLEHPRKDGNPVTAGFPLETLEMDLMRLMVTEPAYDFLEGNPIEGRINPETDEPYTYLIKEEWDAIHGKNTPEQ